MRIKVIELFFLFFLVASEYCWSGIKIDRNFNENQLDLGDRVSWTCSYTSSNNHNYCIFDPDGILGAQQSYLISGTVDTSYSHPGLYQVAYGTNRCLNPSFCYANSWTTDEFIVRPSGGWELSLVADAQSVYVNDRVEFDASAYDVGDRYVFQWEFGDGTSSEEAESDGTSSKTHRYSSAGNYRVRVWLESPTTDEDFEDRNGNRVIKELYVTVNDIPTPPPSNVSHFESRPHKTSGWVATSLFDNDQQGALWENRHTDEPNSFSVRWDKPSDAETRFQYRVDFGSVGENAGLQDVGWTDFSTYNTSTSEGYISSLPPALISLYHSGQIDVPTERFDPNSNDYVMVYYRVRTQNDNGSSAWKYFRGLWFYYRD